MSAQIQITKGTFENLIPSYWSLCTFLNRKATNKVFGILLTLYLAALSGLASLPSIDTKVLPKGGEADLDSKKEIAKSLFDILGSVGPKQATLHVVLLMILGCTASLIASITLSIIMAQLCKFEDAYFKGEESSWPFRSLSLSPLPFFWWIYFELPEKILTMATIFQYWTLFNKNEFQDHARFAPISNKWESLRFLITFSLFTILFGVLKIIFMRFTAPHLLLEPSLPPLGLSKAKDISDETWMDSTPTTSSKTSKTKSKKSLKSNQSVKKRK